jgi:site-specific recombinase XerD
MRTISPLRQSMIDDMTARQLGPRTQRGYIRSCKRFTAFLGRSPETATADDIRRFQLDLAESAPSIFSRNNIVTGVKFLFRVTLRRLDLAAEFYHVRQPVMIPPVLSADEVEQLLTAAKSLRVRVMLSLAYGCGLRAGEVIRLRSGDIDSAQNIIRIVQSKGRKDRHVMLPPCVLALSRQWWLQRPTDQDAGMATQERWLFPGRVPGQPITTRHLNRLFHEAARAAGIRKRVTLHTLRHSFATHLLEHGTDIRLIQALLGHDRLETTAHYTRVATGIIAAVASPIDRLVGKAGKSKADKPKKARPGKPRRKKASR